MLYLDFSNNWNCKLITNCFSTIRLWNEHKYMPGDLYRCRLKDGKDWLELGNVRLINRTPFALGALTDNMSFVDTGYNADQTRAIIGKMYHELFNKEGMHMQMGFYVFAWETRVSGYYKLLESSIIKPYDKLIEAETLFHAETPAQQLELSV